MNFEGSIEIAEMAAEFAVTNIEHGRIARLTGQSLITLNRLSEALQVLEQLLEIFDVYDFRARELYFLWGAIAVVRRLEKDYTWLVAAKDTDTLHADFAQAPYNRLMEGAELLVRVAMNGIELSYDSSSQEIILTAKNSAAAAIATPFLHLLQQKSPGGAKITLKVRGKS